MLLEAIPDDPFFARLQKQLPGILPDYLRNRRWFGGKAHTIRSISISEIVPIHGEKFSAYLVLVRVEYALARAQLYALPFVAALGQETSVSAADEPAESRLTLQGDGQEADYVLRDALSDGAFAEWLLSAVRRGARLRGGGGEVVMVPSPALPGLWSGDDAKLAPSVMKAEQSNTSVRYGDRFILKFYRRIEEGINLDQEIGSFLTEKVHFRHTPPLAGTVQYQRPNGPPATLAALQGYVRNQGDAWQFTLAALDQFLEHAADRLPPEPRKAESYRSMKRSVFVSLPPAAAELLGSYLGRVQLLGKRTGELHLALASDASDLDFAPEEFSADYRRRVAESMTDMAQNAFELLQTRLEILPASARAKADRLLGLKERLFSHLGAVRELKSLGLRTRIHGDYHLGQVLVTADDFAIIDFEGEPERPLAERRLKASPLRDVAGMLRSFHYAASSVGIHQGSTGPSHVDDQHARTRWLASWKDWVSAAFLQAYLQEANRAVFLPGNESDWADLLRVFSVEKAIYELSYELKNRPDWVEIPLDGLLEAL
jgi:maltose alpha-D-glucosyltransferase / alpha-amylase